MWEQMPGRLMNQRPLSAASSCVDADFEREIASWEHMIPAHETLGSVIVVIAGLARNIGRLNSW
jgi:hypothetical protein